MDLGLTSISAANCAAFGILPDWIAWWIRIIRSNGGRDTGA
jgi:hypothetical protein